MSQRQTVGATSAWHQRSRHEHPRRSPAKCRTTPAALASRRGSHAARTSLGLELVAAARSGWAAAVRRTHQAAQECEMFPRQPWATSQAVAREDSSRLPPRCCRGTHTYHVVEPHTHTTHTHLVMESFFGDDSGERDSGRGPAGRSFGCDREPAGRGVNDGDAGVNRVSIAVRIRSLASRLCSRWATPGLELISISHTCARPSTTIRAGANTTRAHTARASRTHGCRAAHARTHLEVFIYHEVEAEQVETLVG